MGSSYLAPLQELQQILAEIRIESNDCFVFGGERVQVTQNTSSVEPALAQDAPLLARLQELLYQRCYCSRLGSGRSIPQPALPNVGNLLPELSRANTSASRWDANWRVTLVENTGRLWAEKGGLLRVFQPGEFINFAEAGSPTKVGLMVSVYLPRESTAAQPGLYFAFGETVSSSDNLDLFRLYWNIDAEGVLDLLRHISLDLNRFQVPFQFKAPIWRQGYSRRDAAVLYVKKRYYSLVTELAKTWREECRSHMRDDVPLFTLFVAPGLSLAEDPETGESFGMNRCRHIAEALWSAYNRRLERTEYGGAVDEQFKRYGIDPDRPYLNAGSVDIYTNKSRVSVNQ